MSSWKWIPEHVVAAMSAGNVLKVYSIKSEFLIKIGDIMLQFNAYIVVVDLWLFKKTM